MGPSRELTDFVPGDHLCSLYDREEEHRELVTSFLRLGLARNEKIFYLTDLHTSDAILDYLRSSGLQVGSYLARGQLNILSASDVYINDGAFDPGRMIALIQHEIQHALTEGYAGLRCSGEMDWSLGNFPGSERLIEYEVWLDRFLRASKCLTLCQYHRQRFAPDLLLKAMAAHSVIAVGAEVYENVYYAPPQDFGSPTAMAASSES